MKKISKYISMALIFMFGIFLSVCSNNQSVSAYTGYDADTSKLRLIKVSVERYSDMGFGTYTYYENNVVVAENSNSVSDDSLNMVEIQMSMYINKDGTTRVNYYPSFYKVVLDTLDIDNMTYENNVVATSVSATETTSSDTFNTTIRFYADNGGILNYINSNEFYDILLKTYETIIMHDATFSKNVDDLSSVIGGTANSSYDNMVKLVAVRASNGGYTINEQYVGLAFFREKNALTNLNVNIYSFNDLFGGSSGSYTEEDLNAKYEEGKQDGIDSVDITVDNQQVIDEYCNANVCKTNEEYEEELENAKQEGIESVDITADNEKAINEYVETNNMKTYNEYLEYGETQYKLGEESVDITADNETAINEYIETNDMKTYNEYLEYGETQYKLGEESVDITTDNEVAISDFIKKENLKSEVEFEEYGEEEYLRGRHSKSFGSFLANIGDFLFGWLIDLFK